jgi:hypothetical protein
MAAVIAFAASAAVLAGVVGVVAKPHHPAARPAIITRVTDQPTPPQETIEAPAPVAAPSTQQFPPGCYPFQPGC